MTSRSESPARPISSVSGLPRDSTPVAVTSRSFSRHPVLRGELLERYEDVRFNDEGVSLAGDTLVDFLRGRRKAITALERIDDALLDELPELEVVSKVGVGTDMVDLAALERHGVRFAFTPGTNSRSVAELVLAFAIVLLRQIPAASSSLKAGDWRQPKGRTLTGRTVGIVGFGHVGRDLAQLLRSLGCRVLASDVTPTGDDVEWLTLDDLLAQADVVTLHLPLDDSTRGLLDERRLALMRADAVLINTARGELVDEVALKGALLSERLAGAALDVFAQEPPSDRELLGLPNFLGTPHIGGSTEEAILAMGRAAIAGLDA